MLKVNENGERGFQRGPDGTRFAHDRKYTPTSQGHPALPAGHEHTLWWPLHHHPVRPNTPPLPVTAHVCQGSECSRPDPFSTTLDGTTVEPVVWEEECCRGCPSPDILTLWRTRNLYFRIFFPLFFFSFCCKLAAFSKRATHPQSETQKCLLCFYQQTLFGIS